MPDTPSFRSAPLPEKIGLLFPRDKRWAFVEKKKRADGPGGPGGTFSPFSGQSVFSPTSQPFSSGAHGTDSLTIDEPSVQKILLEILGESDLYEKTAAVPKSDSRADGREKWASEKNAGLLLDFELRKHTWTYIKHLRVTAPGTSSCIHLGEINTRVFVRILKSTGEEVAGQEATVKTFDVYLLPVEMIEPDKGSEISLRRAFIEALKGLAPKLE
jgi:hypothetical protein